MPGRCSADEPRSVVRSSAEFQQGRRPPPPLSPSPPLFSTWQVVVPGRGRCVTIEMTDVLTGNIATPRCRMSSVGSLRVTDVGESFCSGRQTVSRPRERTRNRAEGAPAGRASGRGEGGCRSGKSRDRGRQVGHTRGPESKRGPILSDGRDCFTSTGIEGTRVARARPIRPRIAAAYRNMVSAARLGKQRRCPRSTGARRTPPSERSCVSPLIRKSAADHWPRERWLAALCVAPGVTAVPGGTRRTDDVRLVAGIVGLREGNRPQASAAISREEMRNSRSVAQRAEAPDRKSDESLRRDRAGS